MACLKVIHIVYASWCPHCVPTTVEPMKKFAKEVGVELNPLDIDTEDEKKADDLVRKYGDWSEDYLIPQVFFEYNNGEIKHVLTGYPEGVVYTRMAIENLLRNPPLQLG